MNDVALALKDKYTGDVNGKLTISGTAFNPTLSGELKLSNGQVSLPESPNTTSTILGIQPITPTVPEPTTNSLELRNLQVILGDNLQITRAPILNFVATGKIDIDGTLDNPRPFGQVQLQKGSFNIFTTQFRLASGPQTADFFPTLGTDPVLNLRLYSKILESTSSPLSQRNSIAKTAVNGEIDRPADFYTPSCRTRQPNLPTDRTHQQSRPHPIRNRPPPRRWLSRAHRFRRRYRIRYRQPRRIEYPQLDSRPHQRYLQSQRFSPVSHDYQRRNKYH
jgi:hypothetical protein